MATGGLIAGAGCATNEEATDENGQRLDEDQEGSAEIVGTDVIEAPAQGTSGDDVPWLRVDVENPTDAPHGGIRLDSTFYDDGNELSTETFRSSYLPAETTLRFYHRGESDPEELEEVEVEIVEAHPQVRGTELEGISVGTTDLSVGGDLINVQGEAELGTDDEFERVTVVALIYDEAGYLRGTGTATEYGPTETFEFGADSSGFRAPHVADPIDDYDVLFFDDLP
ncbi:hypothetical protein [Natrarchaeobaculum aegyptiacum]|uniref:hypothetical protein n=1 Tax=Natrarchaeobaculum aegyptiacum TaxID=745377 RepID=UPI001E2E98E4|nr:hypothetical protein [Natrarchaeobaculum aegyptiacum]